MAEPARKPPVSMESRETHGIRLKPSEIDALKAEALARGIGWTTFARECLLTGLTFTQAQDAMKGRTRVTA